MLSCSFKQVFESFVNRRQEPATYGLQGKPHTTEWRNTRANHIESCAEFWTKITGGKYLNDYRIGSFLWLRAKQKLRTVLLVNLSVGTMNKVAYIPFHLYSAIINKETQKYSSFSTCNKQARWDNAEGKLPKMICE